MIFCFLLLVLSLILLGGWSDATGAITGCVSVRSLPPEQATYLACISTFVGAVVMGLLRARIARTFFGIADFGSDPHAALLSLCAALLSVILWSVPARHLGFPVSESHALAAGMSGAALARTMSLSVLNREEWHLLLLGLLASTLPTMLLSLLFNHVLRRLLSGRNRRAAIARFLRSQRIGVCWHAAVHGAQDCQKYMGVYLLGLSFCRGETVQEFTVVPPSAVLVCASVMSMGTMLGTSYVIKKLGCDIRVPDASSYSASNAAASTVMTLCTLFGLPAGVTHTRASALMGASLCRKNGKSLRAAAQIALSWLLTFPVCATLSFLLSLSLSSL